jgi:translation initiation factor 1 (eIF-1/SUI1)
MFKLTIQLYIEQILSGSKSYLASHPELGVPVGIFNYKDEPDYESRVKSIKKYGSKGNPLSRELAKLFGVYNILPSYQSADDLRLTIEALENIEKRTTKQNQLLEKQQALLKETQKIGGKYGQDLKNQNKTNTAISETMRVHNTLLGSNLDYITQFQHEQNKLVPLAQRLKDASEFAGSIRKSAIKDLGIQGDLQKSVSQNMMEASIEAARFGIDSKDIIDVLASLSREVGRNLLISDETMSRLAVFSEVTGLMANGTARMMEGFDTMGLGIDAAIDKGLEMRSVAVGMGVNVGKFMETVSSNMNVINSYNFQNGVKGFAKMVAQAQKLGISMQSTVSLADKVMDPEGAIDLAAQLQVIGGAVGDLADPFKMMYMATNDLEGLQDAMVSAGEQALVFNDQTGEFGIPPTEIRRMKAMAEQLPISYDELVTASKRLAKEKSAISQMDLGLFGSSEEEEQLQSFIAGMSQFENGQYSVKLKSPDGKTSETIALEDLTAIQKEQFRTSMEAQGAVDGLDEKDIAYKSMTLLEQIAGVEVSTEVALKTGMSSELQDLSDNSIKMTRDASKVLSEVMKSVGGTLSVVAKTIVTGEENMDKVLGDFAAVWSKTSDQIQESGLGKWFNEAVAPGGDTTFNADNDGGGTTYNIPTEKDAFTSGAALIIPKDQSQTPYMTSSFDNTYTTPDLGYGEIGNSMPSEGKTNKHDINVNIVVGGTLQTLGFKPSDLINDHQLMMSLKHQLDLTSMTGKAVEGVLASSTRNSDYVA